MDAADRMYNAVIATKLATTKPGRGAKAASELEALTKQAADSARMLKLLGNERRCVS